MIRHPSPPRAPRAPRAPRLHQNTPYLVIGVAERPRRGGVGLLVRRLVLVLVVGGVLLAGAVAAHASSTPRIAGCGDSWCRPYQPAPVAPATPPAAPVATPNGPQVTLGPPPVARPVAPLVPTIIATIL